VSPVTAPVVQARRLAAGVFSVWIRQAGLAQKSKPGQFLNVRVLDGLDALLRRPISIADKQGDRLRLVFRTVGRGTEWLSRRRAGDSLDILGPLGRPAPTPTGKDVFLVGGGIGAAPLLFLCRRLAARNRLQVFLGARDKGHLILRREFRDTGSPVRIATDDGSAGQRGMVTELAEPVVKQARSPVVYACGPKPMLAELSRCLDPIPVLGFVEERMGCGTGICYCCALERKAGGYIRFCQDGPVVLLNEVKL